MTVSHAAEDAVLGGERTSDGLWTHRGKLVVRSALELQPAGQPAGGSASLVLPNGSITGSMIADGTLTTADLAAGTAQALIGSYSAVPSYSTTTISTWLATPVTTGSLACSGSQVRVECSTVLQHSVAGALAYTGLWIDGALWQGISASHIPQINGLVSVSWTYYTTVSATNHTFQLAIYNATAGTASLYAGALSTLYVTEQRR